jgi:outer membrane protein OmpA-like peptidoglycan-associated protein
MSNKWLIGAMSVVLVAGAATAKEQLEKEHKAGMMTGAAMGAVAGGPVGAAFGLIVGAIGGDFASGKRIAEERSAALQIETENLQAQLEQTQQQLLSLSQREVDSSFADALFTSLAERLHGDVLFRTGSAELDPAMAQRLSELGALVAQQRSIKVEVDGFADPRGKKDANQQLSEARANAVREALIQGGLEPERIQVAAHGETRSTALSGDEEAYAWERRVSVAIRTANDTQVAKR